MPVKLILLLYVRNQKMLDRKSNISFEDNQIPISSTVTYLGFFLDQNLTFQQEAKNVACGNKTLNAIKNLFNTSTRFIIIVNALVLSHPPLIIDFTELNHSKSYCLT